MRDVVLTLFLFGSLPFILWRPTYGVFLWAWVSVMSPHRLTWDFAYDFRFALLIAIATLVGILISREPKRLPVTPVTVVLFLLVLWMNVTTLFSLEYDQSLLMWDRVMKIMLMTFVALFLLHTKLHIQILIWILALSVGFFGIKGGLFTLKEGGEYRVWGPAGSFIEDNNALALAIIMIIPLLWYLHHQMKNRWVRWGLLAAMVLCGLSVLGSHFRGGFVAIMSMIGFLWWKSHTKLVTGFVLAMLVPAIIGFMPDKWDQRMWSIQNYEQDGSAMARFNAWTMAVNIANDRPLVGGGFEVATEKVYALYAPDPSVARSLHSVYFQMLGEHGYVGLALFLLLWALVWRDASMIINQSRSRQDLQWAFDLARMIQVSLIGYAVGGAFLNLSYYDVPYFLLAALALTRVLVEKQIKSPDQSTVLPVEPQTVNGAQGARREAVATARPFNTYR